MCVSSVKYDEILKIIKFVSLYHFAKPIHSQKKTKFDLTRHKLKTLKHPN